MIEYHQTRIVIRYFIALMIPSLFIFCQQSNKVAQSIKDEQVRPNIIYIMTDDHTKQATSLYDSSLIQTPNIDRIGREGIRFDRAFVTNSICAPSRAVMLTGKYSHMNGLRDNHDVFDSSQVTFPKLLRQSGYQTAVVGKWHLKTPPAGFDYWNILTGQGHYYNPDMIEMGDTSRHIGYSTDISTDIAINYLDNRDTTKPFCLIYHHKAPHRNWMPDTKHFGLLEGKEIPLPESFFDDYSSRTSAARDQDMRIADMYLSMDMKIHPDSMDREEGTGGMPDFDALRNWKATYARFTPKQKSLWDSYYSPVTDQYLESGLSGDDLARWKYQRYIIDYLRCVASVDDNIGRILNYLEENQLENNTIVVYTSDQGFYLGEHGWYDKRFMYEESFSTPLLVKYPVEIEAGQSTNAFALNVDFASTFLDYADIEIPPDMQGKSLRPLCKGEKPIDWRKSVYYHYYQSTGWHKVKKHDGVRTDRYKLIHFYEVDEWELFDLKSDPGEMNNKYGNPELAEVQESLHKELTRLRNELKVDE
jgi:arylsulfatase A-like enzyme